MPFGAGLEEECVVPCGTILYYLNQPWWSQTCGRCWKRAFSQVERRIETKEACDRVVAQMTAQVRYLEMGTLELASGMWCCKDVAEEEFGSMQNPTSTVFGL